MTLLRNDKDKSPGTHALVIGVGGYPRFRKPEMGLRPAFESATLVANWLFTMFRNPSAPLASLDVLASAPKDAKFDVDRGDFEQPTSQSVELALEAWFARCQSHEDNIALFFFSGHGAYGGADTLLCLDDFPGPGRPRGSQALSFDSITDAMLHCKAGRQVYFVDTARIPNEAGVIVQNLAGPSPRSSPPRRTIIYSTPPLNTPFARRDSPSFFAEALVDALMHTPIRAETGGIRTAGLAASVNDSLAKRLHAVGLTRQTVRAESLGSFDLHFPDSDSVPPSKTETEPVNRNPQVPEAAAKSKIAKGRPAARKPRGHSPASDEFVPAAQVFADRPEVEAAAVSEKESAGAPATPLPPPPPRAVPGKAPASAAKGRTDSMAKSELAAALHERAAWLPDKRVKFDFGPAGVVILDGIERRVTEEDGPADTRIELAWEDWEAMSVGTLDGMSAFMEGKLKVDGDMSNAMELQTVLARMSPAPPERQPESRSDSPTARASGRPPEAGPAEGAPSKPVPDPSPAEAAPADESPRTDLAEEQRGPDVPPSRADGYEERIDALIDDMAADPDAAVSAAQGPESNTEFIPDDAETERDELGRSVLAIGLARRIHRIWRTANEGSVTAHGEDERAAFVVHLDSPWGGGKTTFANYLARVLNPLPGGRAPAAFLSERYGEADLGGIFLDDPPADEAAEARLAQLSPDARRPWIVVPFNAWQVEHCAPPWWVFYQAIRKGCFDAVGKEGVRAWRPGGGQGRLPWAQRFDLWAKLWLAEIGWRLANPKARALLLTVTFSLLTLFLLQWFGAWGVGEGKEAKAGFLLTSGFGLAIAGLTGGTALWGVGTLLTESMSPGSDPLAERLSLGRGDPFARFRRHFARTIARVRRPVMVVVDDLDRCRPDFVVDLVRGMQTLLRSPRVVFVILGDRDWIERAFEAHHKAMEKVDVGPEQSFGARFVEKAIQMSFILPAMGDDGRQAYVRRVLLGAPDPGVRGASAAIDVATARAVREVANREATDPGSDPFDTERIVSRALEEVALRPDSSAREETTLKRQVEQLVGETLAINATSSERVERAVAHQLEALAAHFPANPRQIKRIVNAITIYYAVALQRPGLDPNETFRTQLALWVIVMTEWPETWRMLASFPALVRILQAKDPMKAVAAGKGDLPGSPQATAEVVRRIVADADLMALIKGGVGDKLDPERIPLLAQLTPLHSRKRRLPEMERSSDQPPPAPKPGGRAAAAKTAARRRAP